MEPPSTVTATTSLTDALGPLTTAAGTGLPALGADGTTLVGWLPHQAVLGRLASPGAGRA